MTITPTRDEAEPPGEPRERPWSDEDHGERSAPEGDPREEPDVWPSVPASEPAGDPRETPWDEDGDDDS